MWVVVGGRWYRALGIQHAVLSWPRFNGNHSPLTTYHLPVEWCDAFFHARTGFVLSEFAISLVRPGLLSAKKTVGAARRPFPSPPAASRPALGLDRPGTPRLCRLAGAGSLDRQPAYLPGAAGLPGPRHVQQQLRQVPQRELRNGRAALARERQARDRDRCCVQAMPRWPD